MKRTAWVVSLLVSACLGIETRAENIAPRDVWPQATEAANTGDFDGAYKKTTDLTDLGAKYGITTSWKGYLVRNGKPVPNGTVTITKIMGDTAVVHVKLNSNSVTGADVYLQP